MAQDSKRFGRAALPFALLAFSSALACGGSGSASQGVVGCPAIETDGGGTIPDPPDGPAACGTGVCNYQTQEGCEAGQMCVPNLVRASASVVPTCIAAGTKQRDEACTVGMNECAEGLLCFDETPQSPETGGTCRKMCCGGDWSACGPEESCLRQIAFRLEEQGADIPANVDLCAPKNTCNVLDANECSDEGRVCRIVDPTGAVACAPPSDLELDDPCSAASQCGPVQHCVGGRCRRLCSLETCDASCGPGEGTCVHFARDPEGVGECTPEWNK